MDTSPAGGPAAPPCVPDGGRSHGQRDQLAGLRILNAEARPSFSASPSVLGLVAFPVHQAASPFCAAPLPVAIRVSARARSSLAAASAATGSTAAARWYSRQAALRLAKPRARV